MRLPDLRRGSSLDHRGLESRPRHYERSMRIQSPRCGMLDQFGSAHAGPAKGNKYSRTPRLPKRLEDKARRSLRIGNGRFQNAMKGRRGQLQGPKRERNSNEATGEGQQWMDCTLTASSRSFNFDPSATNPES